MSWAGLTGDGVDLAPSPAETARFGVSVARLVVGARAARAGRAEALSAALAGTEDDVVVVRYPADAGDCAAALAASGRDVLPTGALVYWGVAPAGLRAPRSAPGLAVHRLTDGDGAAGAAATVEAVVRASFRSYPNHYAYDPLLDADAALEGYVEWAVRATASADGTTSVLTADGEPVGVATTTTGTDPSGQRHLEVLLAGLVPQQQGRGWYGTLLHEVARQGFADGADRLVISTQVHNTGVQRAWARLGLEPFAAVETVHAVRAGLLGARR